MIEAQITVRMDQLMNRVGLTATKIQQGLVQNVATWLVFIVRGAFQKQASPEGVPWAPLSLRYAARKKGPSILQETGALFEQETRAPAITGNTITLGSTLLYAGVHQWGFDGEVTVSAHKFLRRVRSRDAFGRLLNPKLGKVTRQQVSAGIHIGDRAGHTRHMRIPARPSLPSKAFVEAEGKAIVEEYAQGVLEADLGPGATE